VRVSGLARGSVLLRGRECALPFLGHSAIMAMVSCVRCVATLQALHLPKW
jgi:hypothetical protein